MRELLPMGLTDSFSRPPFGAVSASPVWIQFGFPKGYSTTAKTEENAGRPNHTASFANRQT